MAYMRASACVWVCAALGLSAPGHAASELFQRLSLEAEAGYAFPLGNLEPLLDPSPDFGLRITSSYYGPLLAHVRVHAGRLTGANSPGHLVVLPAGGALTTTSVINFRAGQTRANNAIVTLGPTGAVLVRTGISTGAVNFILDVTGYFD